LLFFFSSRRRHTRFSRDWSSDVCSSDLSGGDDRDAHAWPWTQTAIVHPEELALEVGAARLPELPQDLHVLGAVFVSPCVVRLARPDAHLLVFLALPTGDAVQAATPA